MVHVPTPTPSRRFCARCPSSVHAFRADQERERVDFEFAQQVASEHPEPLLLCLVGKLFTFLRALELELPDVLQVAPGCCHHNS